ncbi:MAG: dihydrofolate reductase [Candidatus Diapherotrites archaeon]|uniref:Dihydrofolate reductase n=1 Tax=Candidatus Iainarchaeum sp. TaxID=3101447 RepID=A0A8T4C5V7_9ARCH|nr:dihydrofolate reductase [Candidatus Diapherotrites archaeon]
MFARIDTVIMGRATFDVSRKLEEKPFAGKRCIVFTRNKKLKNYSNVEYTTQNPVEFVEKIRKEKGKDIWVVGGGEIASELLNRDLIDEYYLFVHPIILGKGISLYSKVNKQINLNLKKTKKYSNGMTELIYTRK